MLNSYRKNSRGGFLKKCFERRRIVMWGYIILSGVVGIIVGIVFTKSVMKKPEVCGCIHIYEPTEPGEDAYVFLDPDIPVLQMRKKKYVTFIVSPK